MRCEEESVISSFDCWDLRRDPQQALGNMKCIFSCSPRFHQNTYAKCILIPKLCQDRRRYKANEGEWAVRVSELIIRAPENALIGRLGGLNCRMVT